MCVIKSGLSDFHKTSVTYQSKINISETQAVRYKLQRL